MLRTRTICLVAVLVVAMLGVPAHTDRVVAASPMPGAYSCTGTLVVTATVWTHATNPVYRLNGSGPGLPVQQAVAASTWTTLTFTLPGPGTWSGLVLEYAPGGVGPWISSGYGLGVSCGAATVACNTTSDLWAVAVGGVFVTNALLYFEPGHPTQPAVTIKAGKSTLVTRLDASRTYYEIIWQDQFLWVLANTLGPNYDDVWKGRPLPTWTTTCAGATGAVTTATTVAALSVPPAGTSPLSTGVVTGSAYGYPVYNAPKDASTYTVQRGDNLFRIAMHFGVNMYRLASVNGIANVQVIYVGQVLNIAAAR